MAPEFMKTPGLGAWDPGGLAERGDEGRKDIQSVESHLADFFATKRKSEILERACSSRMLIAPCNTMEDICQDHQLKARDFWHPLRHPELGASLTYPGPYIKLSETPIRFRSRAPLVGEHNDELLDGRTDPLEETALVDELPTSKLQAMPFEGIKVLDFSWVGVGPHHRQIPGRPRRGGHSRRVGDPSRRASWHAAVQRRQSGHQPEPVPRQLQHQQARSWAEHVEARGS